MEKDPRVLGDEHDAGELIRPGFLLEEGPDRGDELPVIGLGVGDIDVLRVIDKIEEDGQQLVRRRFLDGCPEKNVLAVSGLGQAVGRAFHRPTLSIRVEDLFHLRPPVSLGPARDGFLHGHHDFPPLLGLGVGGHFGHIGGVVGAVVLEIGEKEALPVEDRIIADVAQADCLKDFRRNYSISCGMGGTAGG